jgi:hypothetical protein
LQNQCLSGTGEDYNRRFAVPARSTQNAHRPLRPTDQLDVILTHQQTGVLSKNLTVQYHKTIYQIQTTRPAYALRKAALTICENAKGEVTFLYKNEPLSYTAYKKLPRQSEVVDTKHLPAQCACAQATRLPPSLANLWTTSQRAAHVKSSQVHDGS